MRGILSGGSNDSELRVLVDEVHVGYLNPSSSFVSLRDAVSVNPKVSEPQCLGNRNGIFNNLWKRVWKDTINTLEVLNPRSTDIAERKVTLRGIFKPPKYYASRLTIDNPK
jgi:hypothetical protein